MDFEVWYSDSFDHSAHTPSNGEAKAEAVVVEVKQRFAIF
jgi:hypothetical protein